MQRSPGFERRRHGDRRSASRSGKYERRRNTCRVCHFYKPQTEGTGLCLKHQSLIRGDDFACVWFSAKMSSPDDAPENPPE